MFPCTITKNRMSTTLQALFNTRAASYTYVGHVITKALVRTFRINIHPLPKTVPVQGYNGTQGAPVTYYIILNLTVKGRTCRNCPLVILDSLSQDIIIRHNLMCHWRLKLNMSTYLLE